MIASPSRIFQHFAERKVELEVVANADGTPFDPIAATASVIFNTPEAKVSPNQRESLKRLLRMEAHGV